MQFYYYNFLYPIHTQTPPYTLRATAVKNELSDTEGLGYKLEEKNREITDHKKTIRLKVRAACIQGDIWGDMHTGGHLGGHG